MESFCIPRKMEVGIFIPMLVEVHKKYFRVFLFPERCIPLFVQFLYA